MTGEIRHNYKIAPLKHNSPIPTRVPLLIREVALAFGVPLRFIGKSSDDYRYVNGGRQFGKTEAIRQDKRANTKKARKQNHRSKK